MSEWIIEWMNEWMNEWINEWIYKQSVDDWSYRQLLNVKLQANIPIIKNQIMTCCKNEQKMAFIDLQLDKLIKNLIKNINSIQIEHRSNMFKYFLIKYTWKILHNPIILWKSLSNIKLLIFS